VNANVKAKPAVSSMSEVAGAKTGRLPVGVHRVHPFEPLRDEPGFLALPLRPGHAPGLGVSVSAARERVQVRPDLRHVRLRFSLVVLRKQAREHRTVDVDATLADVLEDLHTRDERAAPHNERDCAPCGRGRG
jgi:hypothetical protein